nr:hypothetical protein [Tanacetum cinerariifolium]
MHNNIMAASSRDRPPMLAPGRYPQWRTWFLRYAEWSRFVTIVKQQHKLDDVSYHKLFDILKQYQNEVNELRVEKLARNANPLALVATAQASQDPYYQTPRSHRSSAPSPKPPLIPSRSHTSTRYKGKEIAKPITPPSETTSEEDSDPKQAQRDKDMQKNLALIAKYFKNIYKPTNNNLRTSSNFKNKNVDMTPRALTAGNLDILRRNAESQKGLKTPPDTDEEVDEQELEALYSYMAKIQEVPTADSDTDSEPVKQAEFKKFKAFNDPTIDYDKLERKLNKALVRDSCLVALHTKQAEFKKFKAFNDPTIDYDKLERKLNKALVRDSCLVALHTKQAEFKKFKAFNDPTIDYDKLEQIDKLESEKAEFSDMYDVILQECISKDVMCSYLMYVSDLDALAELQCMYLHNVKECECLAQKLSKQTEFVSKKVHTELLQRFAKVEKHSISLEIALQNCKEQVKNDKVCNEKASNVFRKERKQYFKIQDLKAQMQDKNIAISELNKLIEKGKGKYVDTKFNRPSVVRQPNAQRIPKPSVLGKPTPFSDSLERTYFPKIKSVPKANVSEGVNHKPNVSRPQLKSNQSRDKVLPNNSQVKVKKTQVEVHPRIPSVLNKMESVTACKDNLNSRTLNANAICAT